MTHEHDPGIPYETAPGHDPTTEPTSEQLVALRPRVWIGSMLDYERGCAHGDWVDATQDDEQIQDAVDHVLATSPTARQRGMPPDTWGIFDSRDFGDWRPERHEDLQIVAAVARGIATHGEAFAQWAELVAGDPELLATFEDAYLGDFESATAWAEDFFEQAGILEQLDQLTEHHFKQLSSYVRLDTEAWAQDAWLSGDIQVVHHAGGRVWIFRNF